MTTKSKAQSASPREIVVRIDKRPVTLTTQDIRDLIRIARDIDRFAAFGWSDDPRQTTFEVGRRELQQLATWLDTHGPEQPAATNR